jgi:hypothetical protein
MHPSCPRRRDRVGPRRAPRMALDVGQRREGIVMLPPSPHSNWTIPHGFVPYAVSVIRCPRLAVGRRHDGHHRRRPEIVHRDRRARARRRARRVGRRRARSGRQLYYFCRDGEQAGDDPDDSAHHRRRDRSGRRKEATQHVANRKCLTCSGDYQRRTPISDITQLPSAAGAIRKDQ